MRIDIQEIELALSLDNKTPRLKIILLDNIVELILFDLIRSHAFDEFHKIGGDSRPKIRLRLQNSFHAKVQYAMKYGVLNEETATLLKVFHSLRNKAYHQAFDTVTSEECSDVYAERSRLDYHERMKDIYYSLSEVFSVEVLELIIKLKPELQTNTGFQDYIELNTYKKEAIVPLIRDNLIFRISRLKDDLAYAESYDPKFDSDRFDVNDFQFSLDYLTINYGYEIIEKSDLPEKNKLYYLSLVHQNPDYIDISQLKDEERLFWAKDIKSWERLSQAIDSNTKFPSAINTWYEINKKLIILEEILEYYIFIAC